MKLIRLTSPLIAARIILAGTLAFIPSLPLQAKNLYVASTPFEPPVFPGSLGNGITRFIGHHFKYPAEAWQQQKLADLSIHALVRITGKIDTFEITTPVELHPALYAEVKRVIEKMEWYPACDREGRKVNAYIDFHFPLVRESAEFSTPMPYGMEKYSHKMMELVSKLNNLSERDKPVDMQQVVTEIGRAAELFPAIPEFQAANSRLLSSANFGSIAVETADSARVWYHGANTKEQVKKNNDDDPFSIIEETETIYGTNFSGRAELWLATLSAILHTVYPSASSASACDEVVRLADLRFQDGRLRPWSDVKEREEAERRIERYKRELVKEWSGGGISIDENTAGWKKVANNLSVDEIADYATYWLERGSIKPGAQVTQLANLIKREKERLWNLQQATPKDKENLIGVKAFIAWLQNGDEGFSEFIATQRAAKSDKNIARYLDNLEEAYTRKSPLLADRYAVVQSLASLVPPASATPADRTTFYTLRRTAEEVFPLRWLAGRK